MQVGYQGCISLGLALALAWPWPIYSLAWPGFQAWHLLAMSPMQFCREIYR
jgi:hypothetical protein